jgi:CopG family transcriptional regulator / antitoxin EndoAI
VRKRINITLPQETLELMNRLAAKGDRSEFIKEAVEEYVKKRSRSSLRRRLKEGAAKEAELDLRIAQEWFDLEKEACPKVTE